MPGLDSTEQSISIILESSLGQAYRKPGGPTGLEVWGALGNVLSQLVASWPLVGGGQGCCGAPHSAQGGLPQRTVSAKRQWGTMQMPCPRPSQHLTSFLDRSMEASVSLAPKQAFT